MADPMPRVKYPRTPGYRPDGAENEYNAWYYKSEVQGAPTGKLRGKRIALKDNVCLAGVPMMNGASSLEGYVPDVDATIVTRILDAGGTIVGKVHCEYFCFSGGSHTSAGRARAESAQAGLLGARLLLGQRGLQLEGLRTTTSS
jgi:amidase